MAQQTPPGESNSIGAFPFLISCACAWSLAWNVKPRSPKICTRLERRKKKEEEASKKSKAKKAKQSKACKRVRLNRLCKVDCVLCKTKCTCFSLCHIALHVPHHAFATSHHETPHHITYLDLTTLQLASFHIHSFFYLLVQAISNCNTLSCRTNCKSSRRE